MVRRDVDACILQAASYEGFLSMMEEKGYELKNAHGEGKYLSAKLPGMKRMIRLKTLGDGYTQENIRRRVREENLSQYRRHRKERPGIVYCKVKRYRRAKMSGLQKKYYARLYRIGRLKKKPYSAVWKYRDEIRKMQKLQAQYQFLVRNNIHSAADLVLVKERLTDKKRTASAEKSRLYRADGRNRELYGIAGEMEKLLECENAYQNGDIFFEDEHSQWVSLENSLKKLGYSYDEVANLKGHYRSEAARLKDMEVAAAKELKLAESIRTDDTGTDRLETERKEDETMEQKKSTEWQPKR
jgi:hypothetical protein